MPNLLTSASPLPNLNPPLVQVANGSRLSLPDVASLQPALDAKIAHSLFDLIHSCWHDNPADRPSMRDLARNLKLLLAKVQAWEHAQGQGQGSQGQGAQGQGARGHGAQAQVQSQGTPSTAQGACAEVDSAKGAAS